MDWFGGLLCRNLVSTVKFVDLDMWGLPLVSFRTCDMKKGRLSDETNGCLHPSFSYIKFIMFGLTHFVSIV